MSGVGTATAVLSGAKLSVTGTFEGLKTPATAVKLHSGVGDWRARARDSRPNHRQGH